MSKPTLTNSGFRLRAVALASSCGILLVGCGGGSVTETMQRGGTTLDEQAAQMRATQQKAALDKANRDLTAALAPPPHNLDTQEKIDAANNALKKLNDAIAAAGDVSDADRAKYVNDANTAMLRIGDAQRRFNADETARMETEREERRMKEAEEAAAMAATAAKLYAGIAAPTTTSTREPGRRFANHAGTAGDRIFVGIDQTDVILLEDKKTTVAANHGWEGKRYAAEPDGDGMYEAMVWSNVGEPKMGRKFGSAAAVTEGGAYEYELDAADRNGNANKALTIVPATHAASVSLPSVTRTAGTETFNLPDPNPRGVQFINVPGMLHGVSGTFSCDPTTDANGCTAAIAATKGFTLGGGTWLFIPTNAEARVTDEPDAIYASYGWWIHTAEDGKLTASAFHDIKGAPTPVVADTFSGLQGTATYSGGAAGKYALSSTTGGTNDAGHFTARATLEADFGNATDGGTITGTIDNFMGADGMARDWSVELKKGTMETVADGAAPIDGPDDGTVWTIDETAASASGEWSGALRNQGMDGVPSVATGTFYTEYGTDGRMVGAFGANKQ